MLTRGLRYGAIAITAALLAVPALAQSGPTGAGTQFELAYWQSVSSSEDPEQFAAYLQRYPQGTFADLAALKIAQLRGLTLPPRPAQQSAPQPPAESPLSAQAPAVTAGSSALAAELVPAGVPTAPSAAAPLASVPQPAQVPAQASARDRVMALENANAAAPLDLPASPVLAQVPAIRLPPTFCSAIERNVYHDEVYRPARAVAQRNNDSAIAHLRALQAAYDRYSEQRDFDMMNRIADVALAYEPVADNSYDTTVLYDSLFERLMAVRIIDCKPSGSPALPAPGGAGSGA